MGVLPLTIIPAKRRQLANFSSTGYSKGRPIAVVALWACVAEPMLRSVLCPPKWRVAILRGFGAKIGTGVLIRHDVRIHWPWKLEIGNNCWIGVGARLLNLEPINIGSDVCISQEAFLCTGSHRADRESFDFDNAPITVSDGAWIAVRATLLRGVNIGANSVVGATALVTKDVPSDTTVLAPQGRWLTARQSNQ